MRAEDTDERLPSGRERRRIAFEVAIAYTVVTVVATALYRVPALEGWFHVVVAALFLYLPLWLLRDHELQPFAITARPLGRNVLFALAVALAVLPPFCAAYLAFQKIACALPALHPLAAARCIGHDALRLPARLRLPPQLLDWRPGQNPAVAELLVVALPEELFFRGYVMSRLCQLWPPRARLLGAPVGLALFVPAALFALCHVVVQGSAATAAVFFPGLLFGWMRARSSSILPGVIFHALCNLYIETLARSFFG